MLLWTSKDAYNKTNIKADGTGLRMSATHLVTKTINLQDLLMPTIASTSRPTSNIQLAAPLAKGSGTKPKHESETVIIDHI